MANLSPEEEKIYEKIWSDKLNNYNGRSITPENWTTIKWRIGISLLAFTGFSVGLSQLYKTNASFRNYTTNWKKLSFLTCLTVGFLCWLPALGLPMLLPYKEFVRENYQRLNAQHSLTEEQKLTPPNKG